MDIKTFAWIYVFILEPAFRLAVVIIVLYFVVWFLLFINNHAKAMAFWRNTVKSINDIFTICVKLLKQIIMPIGWGIQKILDTTKNKK